MSEETECEHEPYTQWISIDEIEQTCYCGAKRKGHIDWGDWEKEKVEK
jgi:hypothetical protein